MNEVYENASSPLTHLPRRIEICKSGSFCDGGTVFLAMFLSDHVEFMILLAPVNTVVYQGSPGQLYIVEVDRAHGKQTVHLIVPRSKLETQILDLMKTAKCSSAFVEERRDEIVKFVESKQYFDLSERSH